MMKRLLSLWLLSAPALAYTPGIGYPQTTFASLPAAASNTGKVYLVTDVCNGSLWYSTGTRYKLVNGRCILSSSAVSASITGTLTETTLATVTVPANVLGTNGQLAITSGWSHTNSANTKTLRVRYDGAGGTAFSSFALTTAATSRVYTTIQNRNATNSQGGVGGGVTFGTSSSTAVTASVDTTAATTLALTGQLSNTGETITLESATVELITP
ncbi:hypothetical protein [Tautonia plasticadhaerens]|uniref:Uncharacterized protein n=1 Tax=Tautonia plasticadhaerens TaxID=2527974 RepID=A0A518H244_9BACT|nr:hypothetical protein [Tautonia plasticadhaerens]QDV34903.1 hypothetical protein ElP_28000 [Tautonia plasticadhaerens]